MDASLTQYLDKELRRPVRNSVKLREVGAPLTMTKRFTILRTQPRSPMAALSTANNSFATWRELALLHADLIVHLPAEELAALLSETAGEMNLVT